MEPKESPLNDRIVVMRDVEMLLLLQNWMHHNVPSLS